jgi:hypothetical protein
MLAEKKKSLECFIFFGLAQPPAKIWHWTVEFIYVTQKNYYVQKGGKLRPARDWESLNCRLVTQHNKMH